MTRLMVMVLIVNCNSESAETIEIPITDCGGLVDDYGGVITMNNMSSPDAPRLFDCIWLVKPMLDYRPNSKSHLLVRLEQLSYIGIIL